MSSDVEIHSDGLAAARSFATEAPLPRRAFPFEWGGNFPTFLAAMDGIFALVRAYAERLHGPLEQFTVEARGSAVSAATGEWRGRDEDCLWLGDGTRQFGGALERFFGAHFRVLDEINWFFAVAIDDRPKNVLKGLPGRTAGLAVAVLAYGWALADIRWEVPELKDLTDLAELVVEPDGSVRLASIGEQPRN